MSGLLPPILSLMFGLSVALVFVGLAMPRRADPVQERLSRYGTRQPRSLEEIELQAPFYERAIQPIIRAMAGFVTRFAPRRNLEALQHKLDMAGNPNNWTPADFMGVRGLAALITGSVPAGILLVAHATLFRTVLFAGLLGALGFFLPAIWLGQRIRSRQHGIVKSLPDALDLLTISVEAGLGFDAALAKVTEKWDNELSQAFGRVISEIRIGKSRREALREMAYRMEVEDVTSFIVRHHPGGSTGREHRESAAHPVQTNAHQAATAGGRSGTKSAHQDALPSCAADLPLPFRCPAGAVRPASDRNLPGLMRSHECS